MRRTVIPLALVWLMAFNLRLVMFAIPPALPAIRSDLGLSFSATGSITSLLLLTLGLGSIPGALLTTRFGARRLVTVCGFGLVIFTASVTLRPPVLWVFAGSSLLAFSIAFAQSPLTVLIRRWFPIAIARATSLYGNGLLIGGVAGSSLAPYLVHFLGWRGMFLVLAAVVLAGVLLWARLTPTDAVAAPGTRFGALARNPRVWQTAALFTFQNVVYYTVATWLPFLLRTRGPGYLALTLLCLNCIPILPLILLSVVRWQFALSSTYYVVSGLLCAAGAVGLLLRLVDIAWLLAFSIGLGTAAAFIGSLALPPLIARDEGEVAGFSALLFTSGYVLAFVGPVTAGALVDGTGLVVAAFWPAVVAGLLMAVIGSLVPRLIARSQPAAIP